MTPPFLNLPVHETVRYQVKLGLDNVESTVIVGPRGVGKTETMRLVIADTRKQQLAKQLSTGAPPRNILSYATAEAQGTKTVLVDIYSQLRGRPMGRRSKQDWTPTEYVRQITERLREESYALIHIDEAQKISPANIDLLRQLMDAAHAQNHGLRVILAGNEELPRNVAETGQLGERFTGFVEFPPFSADSVAPHLAGFDPGLAALQSTLTAKEWKLNERALFGAAQGSFRRLCTILANARELGAHHGRTMSAQDLDLAIKKLPPTIR